MNIHRRRFGLAVLAAVTALAATPYRAEAGSYSNGTHHKHRRPASDQISAGVCVPGEPDYDPDECYRQIKGN